MNVVKLVSSFLESNTFIVEKEGEVIIVDCGCELEKVKDAVGESKVVGILLTHGHFDHSVYCNEYAKHFNCLLYANTNIKATLTDKIAIYSEDYSIINDLSQFKFLDGDGKIQIGNFDIDFYHFPGHSHCCEGYVIDNCLFAGDFLFAKSFGRIDLKNSNKNDMLKSLEKVGKIQFEKIYSGHGEESNKEDLLKNLRLFKRFLTR